MSPNTSSSVGVGYVVAMWIWWTLACVAPESKGVVVSSDTGAAVAEAPSTAHLKRVAVWTSVDPGYATGAGFADIDGDGAMDLIVANGNDMLPGALTVYHNDGGSLETFPSWISSFDHFHGHLSVGDVNRDGWPDVAVSRYLGDGGFDEPGGVDVYLNLHGSLSAEPAWSVSGFYSFSLDLGDMDGDGDLDLAVATGEAYYGVPEYSRVYANDGSGDFGSDPAWTPETAGYSFDVQWADFDADGYPSLAFANHGQGHTVYDNEGGMLSHTPAWIAPGTDGDFEANTLDVGDVDNDGALDLVVSDSDWLGGVGQVRVWCGSALSLCWTAEDTQAYPSAVSLHDIDGDGDLELFTGAWWGEVRMYENHDGVLDTTQTWASAASSIVVESLCWGDVEGDGYDELAVTDWTEHAGNRLYAR